ncbi:hypothetical protein PANDA_021873, partial [Ailuropoda melanoleuca]
GGSSGDSVSQMKNQVTLSERAFLIVNHSFAANKSAPPFSGVFSVLVKLCSCPENHKRKCDGSNKGFEATNEEKTTFPWEKLSVPMADMAVCHCA